MNPNELEALARRRGIRRLLQFGSSVTGRLHAGSDVDLGVLLERMPESLHELGDLAADLVTRKMLLITSDLDLLRRIAESGRDAYLSSPMHQAAVERYLERVIGRMIDINDHLLTESGQPPTRTAFDHHRRGGPDSISICAPWTPGHTRTVRSSATCTRSGHRLIDVRGGRGRAGRCAWRSPAGRGIRAHPRPQAFTCVIPLHWLTGRGHDPGMRPPG
jgi:predicted nucleotidyltransferase